MYARNRRTGAAITGTLEKILGRCMLIADAFERSEDGRIRVEHQGGTEMFWDSSEQVRDRGERIYLDENGDQVPESGIELHAEDAATNRCTQPRPQPTAENEKPETHGTARQIAERFIKAIAEKVKGYHEKAAAAREVGRTDGEEAAENAISNARAAFGDAACSEIRGVDVISDLIDLDVAVDSQTPIVRHVKTAVIRLQGPDTLQIHCTRNGREFQIDKIRAEKGSEVCDLTPDKATGAQIDVYANAILQAQGLVYA